MKGGLATAALAAMVGTASAINHRHAHDLFHRRGEVEKTCGCTTIYSTITGEPTFVPNPPPPTTSVKPTTTSSTPTPTPTTPTSTETIKHPVPTPEPITCPTPGTYTIPATTVTLTEETTVCVGSSTHVTSGTHTLGGVTTIVETATTVTCPVATTTVGEDNVVTSTIISTEYVCPEAGTYTIAPITTTVTEECDIDVPEVTSYNPGTYTAPEQVITVTDTDFVTVCPYTSSEPPKPKPTTKAPPPPPPPASVPTSKPPPPPQPEPEPEPEPQPSPGGGFDGSFGSDGDHYGMTYTPYDPQTGDCKSAGAVAKDIAEIKADGFNVVRVYGTDCDTLPNVGAACEENGIRMIVGVFVKETGCDAQTPDIKDQLDSLASWGKFGMVDLMVVGNEAYMNHRCTPQQLAKLIQTTKSVTGYKGPITTAETLMQWQDPEFASALCSVVDFTGANIHPFFNPENTAESAGDFVKGQLDLLDGICDGLVAVNLECGWPNGGECFQGGTACPGIKEQADALTSIRNKVGGRTVFFSPQNDEWKPEGDQNWGCGDYFKASL